MVDKPVTKLHADEKEYKEFLAESVAKAEAEIDDTACVKGGYRVFFWCDRCMHAFTEVSPQIISAAMKVDLHGCPKCHSARQVKLTHHTEITTKAQEEIDITEFVKVVPL